ncbi:transposase, partial [Lasius niger]
MLLNPTVQKMRWSADDIAVAISLRSVSPKAYRYLKNVLKIPLPGLSTLRKWASTFCVDEGILTDVLKIIKYKGRDMSDINKLTVDVTKDSDYRVIAVTCDLGPSNQKLLKALGIGVQEHEKCYFQHPSNDALKVFVFADPPHLIKLVRNHYIDQGFNYNGECIKKSCLEKLLAINRLNAYGIELEKQNDILEKMTLFIQEVKIVMKHFFLFKKEFFCDVIENFFSYIRAMGSGYDHPMPLEFRNRLRWYILGKNSTDVFTEGANTENHDSTELCLTNCCDILDQFTSESNATLEDVEFNIFQVTENELSHDEQTESS